MVCVCVAVAVSAITSGTQAPNTTDYAISVSGPSPAYTRYHFFLLWFPLFTRINMIYIVVSSRVAPQNFPRNIVFNASLNCGVRVFVCMLVYLRDLKRRQMILCPKRPTRRIIPLQFDASCDTCFSIELATKNNLQH